MENESDQKQGHGPGSWTIKDLIFRWRSKNFPPRTPTSQAGLPKQFKIDARNTRIKEGEKKRRGDFWALTHLYLRRRTAAERKEDGDEAESEKVVV